MTQEETDSTFLNLTQASREVGLTDQTLRKFIRMGKLVSTRTPSNRHAVAKGELKRFLTWYRGETATRGEQSTKASS